MAISFQIKGQLSLKNTFLDLLFLHSHKPRKNIVVLVGKCLIKKPEYPEMRGTYAQ